MKRKMRSIETIIKDLSNKIEENERRIKFKEDYEEYYRELVLGYPNIDSIEENILFNEYSKSNNKEIRDILFKCHLKEVYNLCFDKTGYRLDLISSGNIVLMMSIDSFNADSTYTNFRQCLKAKLEGFYKRWIRDNEEALNTDMSISKLISLEDKEIDVTSKCRDDRLLRPRVSDEEAKANDMIFGKIFLSDIEDCISPLDKKIITLSYGLDGNKEHSNQEIGDILNHSAGYVSKRKQKAIHSLKYELNQDDYDNLF